MLKLRRGLVTALDPIRVEIDGDERRAWADPALGPPPEVGDEVVVNTEALDLGLGSGGFDVLVVNLTRGLGLERQGEEGMKLNYSPLQHSVKPVEPPLERHPGTRPSRSVPVLVLMLHGQLAPAVWAADQADAGLRVGYVQTAGGALPGALSETAAELRRRGLLHDHVTAGPAYGGDREAITTIGALHAAAEVLLWDAVIVGPGPGIIGSASALGHGGMAALDSAHAALSLKLPVLLAPRASAGDPRARHRGVSHHTRTVLELLLAPVRVPVPGELDEIAEEIGGLGGGHQVDPQPTDLGGYARSGLPDRTMGRSIEDDAAFFETALAAGRALAELAGKGDEW